MMPDIDLIPTEYRVMRQRKVHMHLALALAVIVLLLLSVLSVLLSRQANAIEHDNESRRMESALIVQQRDQLAILEQRHGLLREEWLLLQGLRSGAAAQDLFVLIDRALPAGDVWFEDWQFKRAGVVAPPSSSAVATGYFIVVPAGDQSVADDTWQVRTSMTIRGQARDHAALSNFVRRLFDQPAVHDVKLNRTSRQVMRTESVVTFDLSVTLDSASVSQP